MPEILQEFSIVRRILPPDSLPWPQLVLPSVLERLKARYNFESIERDPSQNDAIVCKGGEFSVSGTPQAVQILAIEANLLHAQTSGGNDVAESLFSDLAAFVSEVDPTRKLTGEYAKTYQTIAIARLSVPFHSIFSQKFCDYLESTVRPLLSLPDARADIALESLAFKVTFPTEKTDFVYLPKPLTIEPRSGSKLKDGIYYTQSPTDSATHRNLLKQFEAALS